MSISISKSILISILIRVPHFVQSDQFEMTPGLKMLSLVLELRINFCFLPKPMGSGRARPLKFLVLFTCRGCVIFTVFIISHVFFYCRTKITQLFMQIINIGHFSNIYNDCTPKINPLCSRGGLKMASELSYFDL